MSITPVGLLLITLGLVLALRRSPLGLLLLLVFFAPFTATAVVNFSNPPFGLQPAYFFGILLMIRLVWNMASGMSLELEPVQLRVVAPLFLLLAVGVVSIGLVPLYASDTLVTRPSGAVEKLVLTGENLTQIVYLAFVVLLTVTISVLRLDVNKVRLVLRTFVLSGICVAIWGWLQVGLDLVGLPYPDELFNNSASFSQLFGQRLPGIGIKRMTSVAPEPSMLARFLIVPLMIALHSLLVGGTRVLDRRSAAVTATFLAFTMIMTMSSTGILGLLVVMVVLGVYGFYVRPVSAWRLDLRRLLPVLVVAPAAALLTALFGLGITLEQLRLGLDMLVFGKLETLSGQGRVAGALAALDLFATHPIFGVGWGSNRSFDLVTNILSNVGIIGFGLLAWIHLAVLVPTIQSARRLRGAGHTAGPFVLEAAALALLALLGGKVLSEPNITNLDQWILIGVLTASFFQDKGPVEETP
jgi:hypothetical protein